MFLTRSGKTSVGKIVAQGLGYVFVDTCAFSLRALRPLTLATRCPLRGPLKCALKGHPKNVPLSPAPALLAPSPPRS